MEFLLGPITCRIKVLYESRMKWTWHHSKLAAEEVSFFGGLRVVLLQLLSIHDRAVAVTNLGVMLLCSNYIFILYLTLGFNGMDKGNCKTRRKKIKHLNLVGLMLEVWWYVSKGYSSQKHTMQYNIMTWLSFFFNLLKVPWGRVYLCVPGLNYVLYLPFPNCVSWHMVCYRVKIEPDKICTIWCYRNF